MAAEVEGNF